MQIIALCGQKGSGKDLVADTIVELLDGIKPTRKLSFTNQIKELMWSAFDIRDQMEWASFVHNFVTLPSGKRRYGREIYRVLSLGIRNDNAQRYIERLEDDINNYKIYHPESFDDVVFIVTDVRFREEVKWCKANKIPLIKVNRDTLMYDSTVDEIEIEDYLCDHFVDNNGTEKELKENLVELLTKILK